MAYVWGKFLGLSTTDDQGMGCAVDDEGGVFGTTLTTQGEGEKDTLVWGLYEDGETNFVMIVGYTADDMFSSIIFNDQVDSDE